MKRIDFENGTVTGNILGAALPMLVAQILSLLYNIVDRVYIARIPEVGTAALGAVGLCFPLVVIITAFANLFGSGGAPLFSIKRGMSDEYLVFDGLLQCGCLNDDWITICPAAFDFIWSLRERLGLCISVYDDLSDWNTAIYGCSRNESFYQCSGIFNNRNVFGCNWSNCKFTT